MSYCKHTFCNLQLLNWAHRQRNTRMLLASAIHRTNSSFLYRKPASKDHLSISCIGLPCTPAIQLKELCLENSNLKALIFQHFSLTPLQRKVCYIQRWLAKPENWQWLFSLCSLQQESHAKKLCAGGKPWICRKHIFENGCCILATLDFSTRN